jgi:hypothetical protein
MLPAESQWISIHRPCTRGKQRTRCAERRARRCAIAGSREQISLCTRAPDTPAARAVRLGFRPEPVPPSDAAMDAAGRRRFGARVDARSETSCCCARSWRCRRPRGWDWPAAPASLPPSPSLPPARRYKPNTTSSPLRDRRCRGAAVTKARWLRWWRLRRRRRERRRCTSAMKERQCLVASVCAARTAPRARQVRALRRAGTACVYAGARARACMRTLPAPLSPEMRIA